MDCERMAPPLSRSFTRDTEAAQESGCQKDNDLQLRGQSGRPPRSHFALQLHGTLSRLVHAVSGEDLSHSAFFKLQT